ncbi:MAG: type IV pilus biogenesis protein PilM [Candidatus Melainabacteria bacterium]
MGQQVKNPKVHVGIAISIRCMEVTVFSPKTLEISHYDVIDTPHGMLDPEGVQVLDPEILRVTLSQLLQSVPGKPKSVNLSLPATLLRAVDMPRMDTEQLYVSLSSEAERYKSFDNTEAVVDFAPLPNTSGATGTQRLIFGGIRQDTVAQFLTAFKALKVKVASIDFEDLNTLRGMAGTGVLDNLVGQIGENGVWGTIFVEPQRVRLGVWQGNQMLELRETQMDTRLLADADPDSVFMEDLIEEIRRTAKDANPSIWLTQGLNTQLAEILENRLGALMSPCPVGGGIALPSPAPSLAAIGCALISTVAFPFEFNLLYGLGGLTTGKSSADVSAMPSSGGGMGGGSGREGQLLTAGVAAIVLALVASGLLYGVNAFWADGEAAKQLAAQEQLQGSVNSLLAEKAQLEAKNKTGGNLALIIKHAKVRNRLYVDLTKDMYKVPKRLWVNKVTVGDRVSLSGKALNHQDVINFAKMFDHAPYVSGMTIKQIDEEKMQETPLFNYAIEANLNLDNLSKIVDEQLQTETKSTDGGPH